MQWNKRRAIGLVIALTTVFVGAIAGYMYWEQLDLLSAAYFVVIAITTVGFGDIHPTTTAGQLLTILFVPTGIVLLFGLGFTLVQHHIDDLLLRGGSGRMQRQLSELKDHYIVCGYGRLGRITAASLQRLDKRFVVLEHDSTKQKVLQRQGYLHLIGDALDDSTLQAAGIDRCSAVISTFSDDKQNVYLLLQVRDINSDVNTVSAASSLQSARRLYQAGAKCVVTVPVVGGELLAKSAVNPYVYHLMSDIRSGSVEDIITQIIINAGSRLDSLPLRELSRLKCEARVLAVRTDDRTDLVPSGEYLLEAGSVLVAVGNADHLRRLEELAS